MDKDRGYVWAPYFPTQPKHIFDRDIERLGLFRECVLTTDGLKEILSEGD